MKVSPARAATWGARILVGFVLLVALAAAAVWWWAGREGSLEWLLRRVARDQPLQTEGVTGSLRGGWQVQRIAWEKDGLRLEAEGVRVEWQPLALLNRTLLLEQVQAARVRVTDSRPATQEPLKPPDTLALPVRVFIDDLSVERIEYRGRTDVDASRLAAQYGFDGARHRVALHALQFAGGDYRGEATLLALPPLTLDAKVAGRFQAPVPGSETKVPLTFQLQASGPASAINARAQLQVQAARAGASGLPQATATARITPFEKMPVPQAAADFRRLDLALFWPAAPRTQLSGRAQVAPAGAQSWRLEADVANAAAGPWDAQRLPITAARGEGEWRDGTALVKSLQAQVGGGTVGGSGRWEGTGWQFDGRIAGVDPSQVHRSLAPLPLSGPVKLAGKARQVDFDLDLQAGAPRRSANRDAVASAAGALELRDALARGRWSGDTLSLAQLRVRTSDAVAEGQLELQIAQRSGSGKLQVRAPGLNAQAQGSISAARGQGTADVAAPDLALAQRWLARWPGVGPVLKDAMLRGEAQAQLAWQGGWEDPSVQARATLRNVAWQARAQAQDAAALPWSVREAQLQLQGRLRDAALELRGQAERGQRKLDLSVAGRAGGTLSPSSWRGRVAELSVQMQDPSITPGPWQVQLQRPVDWRFAGGNFELSAGEAALRAPAMRSGTPAATAMLSWTQVRRERGRITTTGKLAGLPLAWVELVGGPQLGGSALSGDMVFDAQWDAQLGDTLRVDASLARVRGDVTVLAEGMDGAAARVTAGVRDARLTVSTQGEQVVLSLLWDSERAGRAEGQLRTRLVRTAGGGWDWPEQAPLAGRVRAQLPRIGVWSLLAPPGWRLRGSLDADITVAGTRVQPHLSGPLSADDLALRSVVDGIELRGGRLRAQLAGQKLVVQEFLLHGSEQGGAGGSVTATGEGAWTPQGPVFEAQAQFSQLRASIRSDRQLTVSGSVAARVGRGGTSVTGDLTVDRARIQVPDESPPRLGDDVVVRNAPGVAPTEAERKARPAEPARAGNTVTLRVGFDLGPDFRVSGRGLETRLTGKVQVQGVSGGVPQMTGLIQTAGGTFEAYGQRMTIERGELRFTGAADNPALDILAVRPNMTQKVGVLVSGRAQFPHIELYSDAGLSDAETLSYIVLGRSSTGGGAETALLQRAASALLAGRSGTGKGFIAKLGIDDLTVARDSTSGTLVRLGKRFGENFYAAYERSLSGAMGTLFIFYDVSRRVTVRAEAGDRTGVDLIFTFAFDGPGGKR
ncbi:translocation/assembly module TamB domain-containing protein [Ramlibacter sp. PS3R-8]|uniref:translocation/assembly module TamB domain-containing protein n=1 Tax=Ramlibacter sp. PS3R-8 TaxID=3133437 RepID=UPI00309F3319